MSEPIKLIVGLGNPGEKYRGTRHNAGADFVATLAQQHGVTLQPESKFFGLAGRLQAGDMDIRLLIPTTYMNRSGQAVSSMAKFFKIDVANILVAHDELDFAPGEARFKIGGGHGGHNGLRDIISAMSADFVRLRIGIGHPGSAPEVTNYVLKPASQSDRLLITDSLDRSADTLPMLAAGELAKATHQLHSSN
ncbi:aminoacyl-tRNA hydrolase [Halieaceae bacterium IMCC14734]|uniref:Peptidyl-tRNA hydrolase n=1 Tax=Candidatus Litorirhabdus singularis TaxID=2518993 RepID=A0ABT3TJK0_9GAMM|nr:aminoacyl-tRNA hydrolase [Candidatus Litorirhabdus singularis]MCX2982488.1 aminoacyl-tRNA hydrolase [Candidatus Litorirhabdus singularis]